MKVVAIVQARMGSTRLPGKVLGQVVGKPMLELLLLRLAEAGQVDQIVIATSDREHEEPLIDLAAQLGVLCVRGSESDVLGRYLTAARAADADVVVRITGDCPLIDPALVDKAVSLFRASKVDYLSNVAPATYPDGLDIEVFSREALERAADETDAPYDREHVTPYLRQPERFRVGSMVDDKDWSSLRWTVDEQADMETVIAVFDHFSPRVLFGWEEVLALYQSKPELFAANQSIARNEGADMSKGQKLWKRAKQVIPGGNMLLSKRAEMFLPDQWPAYFSKASGCKVWDLDGKEYLDTSLMGVGTNVLGYGHPEVDEAAREVISLGNMSTLNCPEEVYLAEKLIEMHPWADMARFARSGGEANALAIRIARAASGRDAVAVCGYHGWHDWYLSANLGDDENLSGHLLPGLEPRGVPQNLKGTVFPFNYNDISHLESLVKERNIGVIKMEVVRNMEPADGFLHKVRQLATENGIVLIFDECTSGFRQTFGGLHKLYGVEPDMAVFGKTLGNGYAITATIGRRAVMEAAQSTFISSTFWTERLGPAAALKALEVMERVSSWQHITEVGNQIKRRWQQLADKHGLMMDQWGLPSLAGFSFRSGNALEYKTLITQEMLAKGFLASNAIYVSMAHTPEVLDQYFEAIEPIFAMIRECEDGRPVAPLLKGPVCHAGFKRLN